MILGFLRDFLFVNLNYQASKTYYHTINDYRISESIRFLESWSYTKLYYTKWALTILFSSCYALLTLYSIHLVFKSKFYNKLTMYTYLTLLILSFIAFGVGYLSDNLTKGYSIARQMMGWLQSPIILMLLMPALLLNKNKKV